MEKEEGVSRMPLDEVRGTAATVDSQEGYSRGTTGGEVTNKTKMLHWLDQCKRRKRNNSTPPPHAHAHADM